MLWRTFVLGILCCGLPSVTIAQAPDEDDMQGFEDAERGREETPRGERRGEGEERGRRGGRPPENLMFNAIDADGDGVITDKELRKAVAAIKTLDTDGNGVITRDEATPPRPPGGDRGDRGERGGRGDFAARLMENDANGDGKLTPDEVPPQAMGMLRDADANGDGAIDRDELTAAMENFRGRGRGGWGGGFGGGNTNPEQMTQQLMAGDQNRDGMLSPQEVPREAMGALRDADLNGDGLLNANEVRQAMETSRQRMERFQQGRGGRGRGGDGEGGGGPRESFRPDRQQ